MDKVCNSKDLIVLLMISTIVLLGFASCEHKKSSNTNPFVAEMDRDTKIKYQQYMVKGEEIYEILCQNCHMEDGKGLGRLIPPLAQSDYFLNDPESIYCIIRHGLEGSIIVNGLEYNQPMPAAEKLTALEIAELTTFIGNAWGNQLGLVDSKKVVQVLNGCPVGG